MLFISDDVGFDQQTLSSFTLILLLQRACICSECADERAGFVRCVKHSTKVGNSFFFICCGTERTSRGKVYRKAEEKLVLSAREGRMHQEHLYMNKMDLVKKIESSSAEYLHVPEQLSKFLTRIIFFIYK